MVETKEVKRKSAFTIKLKPTSNAYKDKTVTIDGKSVIPATGSPPSPDWLDTSDDYNTRKKFVYCSPDVSSDRAYYYSVTVQSIGTVDPRVDVTY